MLIFVEPRIQVKAVIDHAPTEPDGRYALPLVQRDANAQVLRCLFLGEAANRGQRKLRFIYVLCAILGPTAFPLVPRLQ